MIVPVKEVWCDFIRFHNSFNIQTTSERDMFKKLALILLIAAASNTEASANLGFFGPAYFGGPSYFGSPCGGSYYNYNYSYSFQAPAQAYPAYAAPAPIAYYRVPIYIIPATRSVPVAPACDVCQPVAVPSVSSVRYRSTPHSTVLRVRSW